MKIGILTLPLHTNYGGNLQAYALMTVLKDMGHDAWLIRREKNAVAWWAVPPTLAWRIVKKYAMRRPDVRVGSHIFDARERRQVEVHARAFIDRHIQPRTEAFGSSRQLARGIGAHQFDAIVVGSDQVWRPNYAPRITDYFLGFLPPDSRTKRVAYAASFGTAQWTFAPAQGEVCGKLLRSFDAVSVREDSGVELCKQRLGVEAVHVLDPSMLLEAPRYLGLLPEGEAGAASRRGLLVYMLDEDESRRQAIAALSHRLGLQTFRVNSKTEDRSATVAQRVAPPVEDWIRGFRDADFVVTDSFHACAFAILFGKPFIVYGNPKRGLARFESLLRMFGLRQRLITGPEEVDNAVAGAAIDWPAVNRALTLERQKARDFLQRVLR